MFIQSLLTKILYHENCYKTGHDAVGIINGISDGSPGKVADRSADRELGKWRGNSSQLEHSYRIR